MSKNFLFFYLLFLILVSLFSFFFVDINLTFLSRLYTGLFAKREIVTLLYLLIIAIFYFFYLKSLSYFNHKDEDFSAFKKILIVTFIGLVFSYPAMLSYDIFNYILTAKVLYQYHENPYIVMPIEFTYEPWLSFTRATNKIALYGPFWIVISATPFLLGFGNFLIILLNFKLLAICSYFLLLFVLYKTTKSIFRISLFALNPLVIIETFISGHNDVVMMLLAILSLYYLRKKKYLISIVLIIFSIFIKYATIFLLPVFLYIFIQKILKKKIDYDRVYLASFLLMASIFFLSAFREEVYPWYAVWFLCFLPLIANYRKLIIISVSLSLGMLLRDIPFMLTGSYFGITPIAKAFLMWLPVVLTVFWLKIKRLSSKVKK